MVVTLLSGLSSTAFATRTYESQLTEANGTAFISPFALAVDGSDNLWVSDIGTFAVSKFDSSGGFLAQNDGTATWGPLPFTQGLAYGNTANLLYAADSNADDLWVLNPDASYAGVHFNSGLGGGCCFITDAVDNSGGAQDGDIYVGGVSATITRIDASGAASNFSATETYISGNQITGTPAHDDVFGNVEGVAVDPDGDVYAVDAANAEIDRFDSTGTFVQAYTGTFTALTGAIAIDPTNGNILVGDGSVVHEFDPSGADLGDTDGSGTPGGSFDPQGLAVDSTGTLYVSDQSHAVVDVFGAAGPPPVTHDLTVTCTGAGTGSVAPTNCGVTQAKNENSTVTLTATPDVHNAFTGWTVDGDTGACPGTDTCDVPIGTTDHAVEANFEPIPQHDIAVTFTGTGSGSVASSPDGLNCGVTCTSGFDEDSTVTLTATPDAGSTFTGWTVDGDTGACPGTDTCDVPVGTTDHAVVANFDLIPQHTLTASVTGTGTVTAAGINCPGDCSQDYDEGTGVTLTATPAANQHFVGWSGDCSGTGTCQVTMGADHSVTATFAVNTHAVTVAKAGTGTGTVTSSPAGINCGATCSFAYDHGAAVTLTAAATAGSTFAGWSGACTGTGTCQVTVTAAKNVTATFNTNSSPPPPADTDGDGVPDSTDQCDTQAGPASNNGCPVVTPPAAGKLTVLGTAKVKNGKASVKVSCNGAAGAAACEGEFQLVAKVKVGKKKKTKVIGTVTYGPIAAGEDATIKVKLSKAAKKIVARRGKLKAKIKSLSGSEITNDGRTIVLKR